MDAHSRLASFCPVVWAGRYSVFWPLYRAFLLSLAFLVFVLATSVILNHLLLSRRDTIEFYRGLIRSFSYHRNSCFDKLEHTYFSKLEEREEEINLQLQRQHEQLKHLEDMSAAHWTGASSWRCVAAFSVMLIEVIAVTIWLSFEIQAIKFETTEIKAVYIDD